MRTFPEQSSIDRAFAFARNGDTQAFAKWMGLTETPLRQSLARFARLVDSEVVVQETFLRMWLAARDPTRRIVGKDASLKFALRVARNVAFEELRRSRPYQPLDDRELNDLPEMRFEPELPDPALGKAISECIERLPAQPKTALNARIHKGYLSDRELAEGLRMRLNTFLQNIIRARKLMSEGLERRGVRLGEILS